MANFGQLYDYNTSSGVVIPQTSKVKENVNERSKTSLAPTLVFFRRRSTED